MKKLCYLSITAGLIILISSCGILNKGGSNSFYSNHNRDKVKIKKGLFSSKRAIFGAFTTSSIDKGVDKRIISFSDKQQPFHFTLSENEAERVKIQALYTRKQSFKDKNLPSSFQDAAINQVFYAWISGSSTNNLKNWELILKNPSYEEMTKNTVVGILRSPEDELEVHAHNRSENTHSYDALTYEFQLKGIPVAAVQVNGKRQYVWMQKGLKDDIRYATAAAIASLLLR